MLLVLLGGARVEEGRGGVGAGSDVGGEERARDGDVQRDGVRRAMVGGDDDVDLRPLARRGAEARRRGDLGREEVAGDVGNETAESVMSTVTMAAGAAS